MVVVEVQSRRSKYVGGGGIRCKERSFLDRMKWEGGIGWDLGLGVVFAVLIA